MKFVTSQKDIIENVAYLQGALSQGNLYAKRLIANGRCFYVVKVGTSYEFYPSRFIGYFEMTIEKHKQYKNSLDGTETNPALIKIIKPQPSIDLDIDKIDSLYKDFCRNVLQVEPSKHKRTFWISDSIPEISSVSFERTEEIITTHYEGEKVEFSVLKGKRVPQAVKQAKTLFKDKHEGRVFCECCEFDFEKTYGAHGRDFIEAHHINPIGKRVDAEETKAKDFVMLCSNCHRMIHAKKDMLTVDALRDIIKKQRRLLSKK